MTDRLTLNVPEVAEMLGISEALCRRKIADKTIPAFRIGGRILVYRWVREQQAS